MAGLGRHPWGEILNTRATLERKPLTFAPIVAANARGDEVAVAASTSKIGLIELKASPKTTSESTTLQVGFKKGC